MTKRTFPLPQVYRLLEPEPVVLVTTAHKGKVNIMTQSWHTMMEFEPPLVGCVISAVGWVERNDTHHLMLPEFLLGIAALNPTYEKQ